MCKITTVTYTCSSCGGQPANPRRRTNKVWDYCQSALENGACGKVTKETKTNANLFFCENCDGSED